MQISVQAPNFTLPCSNRIDAYQLLGDIGYFVYDYAHTQVIYINENHDKSIWCT